MSLFEAIALPRATGERRSEQHRLQELAPEFKGNREVKGRLRPGVWSRAIHMTWLVRA